MTAESFSRSYDACDTFDQPIRVRIALANTIMGGGGSLASFVILVSQEGFHSGGLFRLLLSRRDSRLY